MSEEPQPYITYDCPIPQRVPVVGYHLSEDGKWLLRYVNGELVESISTEGMTFHGRITEEGEAGSSPEPASPGWVSVPSGV